MTQLFEIIDRAASLAFKAFSGLRSGVKLLITRKCRARAWKVWENCEEEKKYRRRDEGEKFSAGNQQERVAKFYIVIPGY